MSKRLTHEEFISRLPKNVTDNFLIINEYTSAEDYIILEDKLGIRYHSKAHWLFSGRCPSIKTAENQTTAISIITDNLFNGKLKVISEYNGDNERILVRDFDGVEYNTTPSNLKDGKFPIMQSAINKKSAFEIKARVIHGDKYDYSKVSFDKLKEKVIIICPEHGEFLQTGVNHIGQKQGCHKCYYVRGPKMRIMSRENFIIKASKVHKNFYDYSELDYIKASDKINVICPIHGKYNTNAGNHLSGSKCPKCARDNDYHLGYNKTNWVNKFNLAKGDKQCIVYILKLKNDNEEFVKIGRTFRTVNVRFYGIKLPYKHEVIKEIKGSPEFIYDLENKLHKEFKKYKYIPLIDFAGYNECFTMDVLNDIKDNYYEE